MIIKKNYQITEAELTDKDFEAGSVYYCIDTKRVYMDPIDGNERILTSGDPIMISTENERQNLLSPIPNKLYIVLDSAMSYIYNNGTWISIMKIPQKGIDYWNDEDKAEIKAYVDEAILGGVW